MSKGIYYFSGTGNSLKVAKDLAATIGDVVVKRIEVNSLAEGASANHDTIGIVFPVYYYGLPKMVKEFVEGLDIGLGCYVFAVATCGGSVGAALKQLQDILEAKGIVLSSSYKIKMPDNYQLLYSPPSLEKQQQYFKLQEEKIREIAENVNNQTPSALADEGPIKRFFGGSLYKAFKPYEKASGFWTDARCNNCGICERVCPSDNINMKEKKPSWSNKCELCLACMQWCPQKSIQYKKGTKGRTRYHHPLIEAKELFNSKI